MINLSASRSCVADAVDGITSFLDTLQQVPQLLNTCVDSCGLKVLRQVSKPARFTANQAVRGYWVKVSSQPSETEPLRKVAKLLEHSRLHHLSVEIIIEAGSVCGLTTHELSSHVAQLSDFVCVMGPVLSKVSRVEIICTPPQCNRVNPSNTTSGCPSSAHTHQLSRAAETALASVIAAACPEVVHLGTGGWMTDGAIRLLVDLWPKLMSFKILDQRRPVALFNGLFQGAAHSRLTHLDMLKMVPLKSYCSASLRNLLAHSLLTHLTLGMQESDPAEVWLMLPSQLKVLHGISLPGQIPQHLHIEQLERMHFQTSRSVPLPVEVLVSLLRSAPSLQLMSVANTACNTLSIADCSSLEVSSLCVLHQQFSTGLTLTGMHVGCGRCSQPLNGEDHMSLKEVLSQMPQISAFESVIVSSWQVFDKAGCLRSVAQVFPKLRKLSLAGRWTDAEVQDVAVLETLHELHILETELLDSSILQIVRCMPALRNLHHYIYALSPGQRSMFQRAFLNQLKATQVVHVGNSDDGRLGDWRLAKELGDSTVWSRGLASDEVSPPLADRIRDGFQTGIVCTVFWCILLFPFVMLGLDLGGVI